MKPESFEKYVHEMKDITSLEFEVVTPDLLNEKRVAFSKYAKRATHKVYFENTGGVLNSIKNSIKKLTVDGEFKRAKVKGIDPESHEAIYNLFNDTALFSRYDYNEISAHIKLDSSDLTGSLKKSLMIKELLHLYKKEEVNVLLTKPWK